MSRIRTQSAGLGNAAVNADTRVWASEGVIRSVRETNRSQMVSSDASSQAAGGPAGTASESTPNDNRSQCDAHID